MANGDPRGMIPIIRAAAMKYGHDPDMAVRVARTEGLNQFTSGIPGEPSFGAFQLYTGGGMGNEFQRDTGLNPRDPKNEAAMIDYSMKHLGRTGWTPYHGARNNGIGPWAGINRGSGGFAPTEEAGPVAASSAPAGLLAGTSPTAAPVTAGLLGQGAGTAQAAQSNPLATAMANLPGLLGQGDQQLPAPPPLKINFPIPPGLAAARAAALRGQLA